MSEIGKQIRRLREDKDWSQAQLAVYAGSSQPTINQIESGKRNPSTRTLEKIAGALGIEVADLFPKAEEPLSFEEERQRLSLVPQTLEKYIRSRAERHDAEARDPNSPHFRTATTATLWLAEVNEESAMWGEWAQTEAHKIMPVRQGLEGIAGMLTDVVNIMGHLMSFYQVEGRAKKRIKAMTDLPDELSTRRLEKATAEAKESRKRLEEWSRAADG
jgi:transcriptional regulator with XRE-family HTH domain